MLWGLVVLLLLSAIVVLGVLYIKDAKLDDLMKVRILLLVGIMLAISLTISAFKEKRYITFSLLKSDINEVERLFTTLGREYRHKYGWMEKRIDDGWSESFFRTNYASYGSSPSSYEEKLLFISSKNQGASMFLYHLTSKLQEAGVPALYCKFEYPLDTEVEIADFCGLPSLRILEDAVSNWNKRNLIPYILVDGLQHVIRAPAFTDVLGRLFQQRLSFVGNTQAPDIVQKFFTIINNREVIVRTWTQPTSAMFDIIGAQRTSYDFKSFSSMESSLEDSSQTRRGSTTKELAIHHSCWAAFKKVLAAERNSRIGQVRKQVSMQDLKKLQYLGLIKLSNGRVYVLDRSPETAVGEY